MTVREYALVAGDGSGTPDDYAACVDVTPMGERVAFDVGLTPPMAKLLRHVEDIPLTDDDPALPHCYYRRYWLVRAGNATPDGAIRLLKLRFTPLPDAGMGVEWAFADGLETDVIQGVHGVVRLLAGMETA